MRLTKFLLVTVAALVVALGFGVRQISKQWPPRLASQPVSSLPSQMSKCEEGKPGASDYIEKAPPKFLTDCTPEPWGSSETSSDTYAYITRLQPFVAAAVEIVPFGTGIHQHLRDLSIVASNEPEKNPRNWVILSARFAGETAYKRVLTVPARDSAGTVRIEIDNGEAFSTYGIAVLSGSQGYRRNYLAVGKGVYLHEMRIVGRSDDKNKVDGK